MPARRGCLRSFLKTYWRSTFSMVYPLVLLPIFLISSTPAARSYYVLLLVSGYWIFEVIPLAVSAVIPLFLFPFLNLMDSSSIAICYSKNALLFMGGFMIAIAVEYSNLHTRISLHIINRIGFRPKKLMVGLVVVTAFTSMWISATAATVMMIKIVYAALKEMEAGGVCQMWVHHPDPNADDDDDREHSSTDLDASGSVTGAASGVRGTSNPQYLRIFDDTVERDIGINDDELFISNFEASARSVAPSTQDMQRGSTIDWFRGSAANWARHSTADWPYHGSTADWPRHSTTDWPPHTTTDWPHQGSTADWPLHTTTDWPHHGSTADWSRHSTADRSGMSMAADWHRGSPIDRQRRSTTDSRPSRFLSNLGSIAIFDSVQRREDVRRPTKITMCFFLGTSFAANIGGLPSLVGSGPNKVLKGMFHAIFPSSEGINYARWIFTNVPMMLIMLFLTTLWMQLFYLGLWRPNSKDARAISMDVDSESRARNMIKRKLDALPPMSFHELMVAVMSITIGIVWFFRDVSFMPGWKTLNEKVENATVAMWILVLMFMIPAKPQCFRTFSKDITKRPTAISSGLLTWDVIHKQFPWGLIFLLGGGVALAAGLKKSGATHVIAAKLSHILGHTPFYGMVVVCLISALATQVMSNYTVPNVFLPIVAELAVHQKVHPVYYMLPMTIACNLAFCLPSSTPAMAMTCFACHIRTADLLKMAIPVTIICLLVLIVLFPLMAPLIWKTDTYPGWADHIADDQAETTSIF